MGSSQPLRHQGHRHPLVQPASPSRTSRSPAAPYVPLPSLMVIQPPPAPSQAAAAAASLMAVLTRCHGCAWTRGTRWGPVSLALCSLAGRIHWVDSGGQVCVHGCEMQALHVMRCWGVLASFQLGCCWVVTHLCTFCAMWPVGTGTALYMLSHVYGIAT